jgi:hypothetical protein
LFCFSLLNYLKIIPNCLSQFKAKSEIVRGRFWAALRIQAVSPSENGRPQH